MRKQAILWLATLMLVACTAPETIIETVEIEVSAATEQSTQEADELVIYHWWTAGGEREAMDTIFEWYHEKRPGTQIVDNPVAGGGGITLKTILLGLLAADIPPDTFQSLSGAELKMYVDGGYVKPVDDIWTANDLDNKYPPAIRKMVTFDGHQYGIPMNAHRANWLFYNVPLFEELGLEPPADIDEMTEVASIIQAKRPDVAPIGIGTRDKWTTVFLFDVVLLSVGGPDIYEQFYTGQLDPKSDPIIREALEKYAALIPYLYEYHGAKVWSDVVGPMAEGEIGMIVIGDFAGGQLATAGYEEGVDWEAVGFPKKPEEVYLMIVDTFVWPEGAEHPDAAVEWLNNLADPAAQAEFNVIKGSIAIHADVPDSTYPDVLHQEAALAFKTLRIVPDSIHGVLAPPGFLSDWQDILSRFLYSPDIERALTEIDNAMTMYNVTEASEWYWAE